MIGGELEIESRDGGTRVRVRMPALRPAHRLEPDRDPVQERHAGEPLEVVRVARSRAGSRSRRRRRWRAASRRGGPSRAAARPCPGVISSVTLTGTSTAPDFDASARLAAVLEAVRRGVVGVHAQRVRAPAAHEQRRVVHPRVVRAQLAQADQPQREARVARRSPPPGARAPPTIAVGREVHARVAVAELVAQHAGRRCARRARCRAGACAACRGSARARRRPNRSPLGPGAEQQVEQPLRRQPQARQPAEQPQRRDAVRRDRRSRCASSSTTSHSSRASPAGGTTASVYWMNGVV